MAVTSVKNESSSQSIISEASNDGVQQFEPLKPLSGPKIIVIGSGPVGLRFVEEILKRRPNANITMFGGEGTLPYNRIQLSSLLAGEAKYEDILNSLPDSNKHVGFQHIPANVDVVFSKERYVVDQQGNRYDYDKLVFATGSRPHVPNIPGVDQTGVYTFRNLKDAEALSARIWRSRHIVVVGGGLLGLEAARALTRFNTKVTLIQQGPWLMNRQLDEKAGELLKASVEAKGIEVITDSGVRNILGEGRVTGVVTRDKQEIECDTVLLCAGIKANMELARDTNIKVANGIMVDDQLQTSAANVFAIGECCEHRGLTYGLVNPGFEQAAVAANVIANGSASYLGSLEVSRLKVAGEYVCSMGPIDNLPKRPFQSEYTYTNKKAGIYRKIVIYKGKIYAATGFGEWTESRRIQEAYQQGRRIYPWQVLRFLITGSLWGSANNIQTWSPETHVCQCKGVSLGELTVAMEQGANTVSALQKTTQAGTVCGSCKPLLHELTGDEAKMDKDNTWLPLILFSLFACAALGFIFGNGPAEVSDSVITQGWFEKIWNDHFYKQVTGFTLLGLSVLGLFMSMKKRVVKVSNWKWTGAYNIWRLVHVILGGLCAGVLILHTGMHLGENINFYLMVDFLAIILLGGLAAIIFGGSHHLSAKKAMKLRSFWRWTHVLVTWPLPILLAFHILSVYYY
jgi:nitrite reductase (NADH) large subunit